MIKMHQIKYRITENIKTSNEIFVYLWNRSMKNTSKCRE